MHDIKTMETARLNLVKIKAAAVKAELAYKIMERENETTAMTERMAEHQRSITELLALNKNISDVKEQKKMLLQKSRLEVAYAEMEFAIIEKGEDVERMQDHSRSQDAVISASDNALAAL